MIPWAYCPRKMDKGAWLGLGLIIGLLALAMLLGFLLN
jgi:hypothetical protein